MTVLDAFERATAGFLRGRDADDDLQRGRSARRGTQRTSASQRSAKSVRMIGDGAVKRLMDGALRPARPTRFRCRQSP